jgi:LPS-assembly protein
VGRWNYSLIDRSTLEALAGFEYDAGCWSFRAVAHRFATALTTASTSFFLQLELNGVSRIGSNPLDVLRRNISGYTPLDPRSARPDEYFVPER